MKLIVKKKKKVPFVFALTLLIIAITTQISASAFTIEPNVTKFPHQYSIAYTYNQAGNLPWYSPINTAMTNWNYSAANVFFTKNLNSYGYDLRITSYAYGTTGWNSWGNEVAVVAHELGHSVGLDHVSPSADSLMTPSVSISKPSLDDTNGVNSLYK